MNWQKSSYCSEGASCIHVSRATGTIHITEDSDPTSAILTTTPTTFGAGEGDDTPVYLRDTSAPDNVVTTSRRDWEAFVLGVRAGEFDHVV
jgi:hypothetical protein